MVLNCQYQLLIIIRHDIISSNPFQLSVPEEIQCLNSTLIENNCTNFIADSAAINDNENKDCKPYYLVDVSTQSFIFTLGK